MDTMYMDYDCKTTDGESTSTGSSLNKQTIVEANKKELLSTTKSMTGADVVPEKSPKSVIQELLNQVKGGLIATSAPHERPSDDSGGNPFREALLQKLTLNKKEMMRSDGKDLTSWKFWSDIAPLWREEIEDNVGVYCVVLYTH